MIIPVMLLAQPMSGMNWMKVIEKERGQYPKVKVNYTPVTCMQCENAGCIKAAQNGRSTGAKTGLSSLIR